MSLSTNMPDVVGTIDRVTTAIRNGMTARLKELVGEDHDVDLPPEWFVYPYISWENGWAAQVEGPAIFVHTAYRGFTLTEDGKGRRSGPDVNVGYYIRCHRDRASAGGRLGAYVAQSLWAIAVDQGFKPHFHNYSVFGKSESSDWGVGGTILFGLVDGAPDGEVI